MNGVLKGRVQVVDDLCEDFARMLVAVLIEQVQTDAPFPHGKLGNRRGLITARRKKRELRLAAISSSYGLSRPNLTAQGITSQQVRFRPRARA